MSPPFSRVVLDTNVVVSSLWGSKPRKVLDLWQGGRFKALVSIPILQEYQEVLGRFALEDDELEAFLTLFTSPRLAILVEPRLRHAAVPQDPSDDKFIDCAVAGQADCIVSGDAHLLKLGSFGTVPILNPAAFLRA